MSDLGDLYQQVILDHNRRPRNYHELPTANRRAEGFNPVCGDHLTVYLHVADDVIDDVSFVGDGCAISKASASIMTDSVKGKSTAEAEALFGQVHDLLTHGPTGDVDELGKLAVLSGVSEYPARVKCASLSWHALHSALKDGSGTVSTE